MLLTVLLSMSRSDMQVLLYTISGTLGLFLLIWGLLILSRVLNKPLMNWHHTFNDFTYSPLDLYTAIEKSIESKQIPDVEFDRIYHFEDSLLGDQREYLRIKWNKCVEAR